MKLIRSNYFKNELTNHSGTSVLFFLTASFSFLMMFKRLVSQGIVQCAFM